MASQKDRDWLPKNRFVATDDTRPGSSRPFGHGLIVMAVLGLAVLALFAFAVSMDTSTPTENNSSTRAPIAWPLTTVPERQPPTSP